MTQKDEIEKIFNHFYPGFMSFSERMADPALKNEKKSISSEIFMNTLISAFNLGIESSADRVIEYFSETDGEAHEDNYQEEILKLKL